jgi:hypothetical protein
MSFFLEVLAMNRRHVLAAATLLITTAGLTACSAAGSTAAGAGSALPTPGAGSGSASSAPVSSTPTASGAASSGSGNGSAASGGCSMLDHGAAESVLGFSTEAGKANMAGTAAQGGITKVDGCTYRNATQGGLGYDVLKFGSGMGAQYLAAAKARVQAQAGQSAADIKLFDTGLPDSLAFTLTIAKAVDSQVTVLVGDQLVSVAVTRKDGDVAKAQASAIAAAHKLTA